MKKKIIQCSAVILSLNLLIGCSGNKKVDKEEIFNSAAINNLIIDTDANNVEFKSSNDSNIKLVLNNSPSEIAHVENDTLKVDVKVISEGINLKKADTLYVYLPDKFFNEVNVKSIIGNINLSSIETDNLNISSEHGNIEVSNLEGNLFVNADLGEIKTTSSIRNNVVVDSATMKQTLNAELGNKSSNIILTTNTGKITIN